MQVGAGVLGLPSAMAYLGWPGGIIVLILSCKLPTLSAGIITTREWICILQGCREHGSYVSGAWLLDQYTRDISSGEALKAHEMYAGIISLYTLWQLCVMHEHDGKRFNRYHELAQVLVLCLSDRSDSGSRQCSNSPSCWHDVVRSLVPICADY